MAGTLLVSKETNHIYKPHKTASGYWQQVFFFFQLVCDGWNISYVC